MQKILVIEDDIDIQDILKNHLTDAGYEVVIADDGVAGIAKFDDTISLVLLDIMLPKIDGYGVCEVIRQKSQVPIIMLTALSDEEDQLKGFEQQIDDYIPKPFSPKILLAEADYEKNNPAPDIEWWTAEEYEKWIATQKEELEALIGTGDGWYDGQGVFHEWTQESVDATIAEYQETLESIKSGTLYSKDNGEGDTYSMIPPTEDVVSEYGVNVTKENGESVHIGNYASNEELDKALNDAVDNGQLTQAEADAAHQQ